MASSLGLSIILRPFYRSGACFGRPWAAAKDTGQAIYGEFANFSDFDGYSCWLDLAGADLGF
jgi:hypothetical protein